MVKTFIINGVLFLLVKLVFNMVLSGASVTLLGNSDLARSVIEILYHLFYLYPVYLISFIYSSFYYIDIADDAL